MAAILGSWQGTVMAESPEGSGETPTCGLDCATMG